jgi:hypothetical protein
MVDGIPEWMKTNKQTISADFGPLAIYADTNLINRYLETRASYRSFAVINIRAEHSP